MGFHLKLDFARFVYSLESGMHSILGISAKITSSGLLGDVAQCFLVEDRACTAVSNLLSGFIEDRHAHHTRPADADCIDRDGAFFGNGCRLFWFKCPLVILAVGEQDDEGTGATPVLCVRFLFKARERDA